jgi:hypothetical protein
MARVTELQALPLAKLGKPPRHLGSTACDSKIEVLKTKQNGHDICFAKCLNEETQKKIRCKTYGTPQVLDQGEKSG